MSLNKSVMIRRLIYPIQRKVRRFISLPAEGSYAGEQGCINTGAAFVTHNQVEGDYLEFGVFRGDSFSAAYRALKHERQAHAAFADNSPEYQRWREARPRLFAFDSFEGLPKGPGQRHLDYEPGSYSCSQTAFMKNIAGLGVNLRDVVVIPGFFDKSLNEQTKQQYGLKRAAMIMIDCDLYESTVPVLEFITNLVGQGTVIIFHDWFRFKGSPKFGEQRACHEWLERNPHIELIEFWREGPQGVSFIVNLK